LLQVRFSRGSSSKDPPTAVLVHGILGSRRNLQSFARQIVEVGALAAGEAGMQGGMGGLR
jgi:dienelactone hydrolase